MSSYRQMRNKVNNVNERLKRDYFSNKVASFSGNLKDSWKTINLLLNKRSKTTNIDSHNMDDHHIKEPADMAQAMNDYFCSVGKTLRDKIPPQPNSLMSNEFIVSENTVQFEFKAIDTVSVERALGKTKKSFGFGSDGIASHFIKIAFPVISQSLCSNFNLSINTGKFPDSWKTARVAPIFKSGEHDDRSNYRPISVLPVVSRLFEKLIYDPLYNHLDKNKYLYMHLSSF